MCGIAGMVGPGADATVVANMAAAQRHRGPDGDGLWSALGVALGHRRLKIIDLSEAGRRSMSTQTAATPLCIMEKFTITKITR
jgi:asparagine synthase (glutamine-hydrolysing)